ncbi:MAG: response regulator [Nitrospina sp.]|nr:MAG: response regulator [Nitrospina sp.]
MKPKILVADDSASIQKIILMAFAKENVEIQGIENGQAAFELLDSFQPDLVLADTKMPGFDGFELSRRIKESNPAIPVILLESDFEDFDEARFKKSRADDHIAKPFKSNDIIQKVKALLQGPETRPPVKDIVSDEEKPGEVDREASRAAEDSQGASNEAMNEVFAAIAGAPDVEIRDFKSPTTPPEINQEDTIQDIEKLSDAELEASMIDGHSKIESSEELSGAFRSLAGAPVAGTPAVSVPAVGVPAVGDPTAGAPTAGAPQVENRESWDLEPTVARPATPPDLIEETLSNLSALSRNLRPEESAPPAPRTEPSPPQFSSDALHQVIGEHVSRAVEKSMDTTLRKQISGLSDSVMETIRDMVKEIAPEIIRSVVQKEIDNIKKAEND